MTNFQRARTEEQRTARQAEIVAAAREMLAEMPLTEITLNGLGRRVGLAASNVLRYFESREAVLLELVHTETAGWLDDLDPLLPASNGRVGVERQIETAADAWARSLAAHPHFCELISAQAVVLERKISAETALAFKRDSLANLVRLTGILTRAVPELAAKDEAVVAQFASRATLLTGALWAQTRATESLLADVQLPPELTALQEPFVDAARDALHTMLLGTVTR
ncbi:TetR family transcriptional regulator [Kribbella antibiotica]|uniref:TetR family transcriptional regulator n=1 Tax=Kribbella antibiotica TaxID=190195 RepID=A0A4R4ZK60_9ACTN|nr:TetR family transcriptional regulator [Kribbella antibiotica]TDD59093.1 TetR family transcriptional regulator [Kribbella antibiotica]